MVEKLKLCANLTMMFTEYPNLVNRYKAAKACGLRAVEVGFPYNTPLQEIIAIKEDTELQQILINSFPGDMNNGDLGFAAIPGREEEFQNSLEITFKYAEGLQCRRVHFMSGKLSGSLNRDDCFKTLESNLRKLVPQLEKRGIVGLIEPINNYSVPNYILNDFEQALKIVKAIDSQFIRLQLDIFHLQHIHGNLSRLITEWLPFVGHIQIAQVPKRNEPDRPGEINYTYIFDLLKNLKYKGWIGLEYVPEGDTATGIQWIEKFGLNF